MPHGPQRALCVFLLLLVLTGRADAADLHTVRQTLRSDSAPQTMTFRVTRDGETIGHYTAHFRHSNRGLTVTNRIRIEIKLGFATVYALRHGSTEVWRDGRLESLNARTESGGASTRVSYGRSSAAHGAGTGAAGCAPGRSIDVAPSSFWSEALLFHDCMIDPLDGSRRPINASFEGVEVVQTPSGPLRTRRYRLGTQNGRELWFGPGGLLVQVQLRAEDDSTVALNRVAATVAKTGR